MQDQLETADGGERDQLLDDPASQAAPWSRVNARCGGRSAGHFSACCAGAAPKPGRPGSASLAMAARCRASSATCSAAVSGQIGLKIYHCSGAGAMWPSRAVAIFCVAIARSAGELEGTRMGSPADLAIATQKIATALE